MPPSGTLAKEWNLIEAGPIAMPDSPEHLRTLIEEALVPMLGRRPLVDEDGDFVIPVAGALVFVRVVETAPVVAIFSQLMHGVEETEQAVRDVARAQRRDRDGQVLPRRGSHRGWLHTAGKPVRRSHLRELLSLVGRVANDFEEPRSLITGHGPAYGA